MEKSNWLPKDYEVPKIAGNYMKLVKGANKFRVLSAPLLGYEYWNSENKPIRLSEFPERMPEDIRWNTDKQGKKTQEKIKHFWVFVVWNYRAEQDSKTKEFKGKVQILQINQGSLQQQINDIVNNEDWGSPQEYDITITATGDGLERKYSVQPSPHKAVPEDAHKAYRSMNIDLEELFSGGDPFNPTSHASEAKNKAMDAVIDGVDPDEVTAF